MKHSSNSGPFKGGNARGVAYDPEEQAYIYNFYSQWAYLKGLGCEIFSLSIGGPCKKYLRRAEVLEHHKHNAQNNRNIEATIFTAMLFTTAQVTKRSYFDR